MLDQLRPLKPTTPEEVQVAVAEAGASARHIEVIGAGTKRAIGSMDPVDVVLSTLSAWTGSSTIHPTSWC